MGMKEWIEHYFWQGADLIVLLDNNSTDNGATIAKTFSNVIVLHAPKNNAQIENYFQGFLELVRRTVDYVAVVDLDEYMFGKKKTLKECVNEYAEKGYSQLSVNWAMFGSDKHLSQPLHIRQSFLKRKRALQTNQKSIWKIKDLIQLHVHKSEVRGKSIDVNRDVQLNHYIIQSREYFQKVKMKRGDVHSASWNGARTWEYFDNHDFDEITDTLLHDQVSKKHAHNLHESQVEGYWGLFEYNPTSMLQTISYLPIGMCLVFFVLFIWGGSRLLTLWCSLHFLLFIPRKHESQQIRKNKFIGNLVFGLATAASVMV